MALPSLLYIFIIFVMYGIMMYSFINMLLKARDQYAVMRIATTLYPLSIPLIGLYIYIYIHNICPWSVSIEGMHLAS